MHTLLQTQFDISEMASRMYAELLVYILGLIEPAFPLAWGEYSLTTSSALVIALIACVMVCGAIRAWLGRSVDVRRGCSSEPAPEATADIPDEFVRAYRDCAYGQATPTVQDTAIAPASARTMTAPINTSIPVATVTGLAVVAVLQYAFMSYLMLSVLVFGARLLVGVG